MQLEQMLFSQGFGTRYECRVLIEQGRVVFDGKRLESAQAEINPEGKWYCVDGKSWPYVEKAVLMLNKPADFECSAKPKSYPSVLSLLPPQLRRRGVQPVGRLDADATGLLLLTDDGMLNHRLTHPKHHVEKTYRVGVKHFVSDLLVERLLSGVMLRDEDQCLKAIRCEALSEREISMTISSGKYHQVKRMVAAAGNRVVSLHRESFGGLTMPSDLLPGTWTWVFDFAGR